MSKPTGYYHQLDWDDWRARRATMTDAEQKAFHADCIKFYPNQKDYNLEAVTAFFDTIPLDTMRVVEIGGYDGELAITMLGKNKKITDWTNIEFAPLRTVHYIPGYHHCATKTYKWWEIPHTAFYEHVLVASHVFEHLTHVEIKAILEIMHVSYLYIDFPCGEDVPDWNHFAGTHCVDIGWKGLSAIIEKLGFRETGRAKKWARWYQR